jgi:hypothetical protein
MEIVLRRDWEWLATLLEVSDDFPVKLKCIAKRTGDATTAL